MNILKIAAFSDGNTGGNPAGVVIGDRLPDNSEMQKIAAEVGFSETVFARPDSAQEQWVVRYFSPETEVPFCGHATIALGAALALREGNGIYNLSLSDAEISVEGKRSGDIMSAALQSPPTGSTKADDTTVLAALDLFGYNRNDLNGRIPPAIINAGASHLVLALKDRTRLSQMAYDLDDGRTLMKTFGLVTISLIVAETDQLFHARNPFASGGVLEDPATGAAAAALAGYLRDLGWPHQGVINIVQGEDMGQKSLLRAEIPGRPGSSIRVSGTARFM